MKSKRHSSPRPYAPSPLRVEELESRYTPYTVSGNAWVHPELVTLSFVPDGTVLSSGGTTSNLLGSFNARFGSAAAWQKEVLRAAQTWAQYTNINFSVVSDNGASIGSGSYQQGDPNFGDIRIGGYNFGSSTLAQAYMPPPVNNYSIAGDFQFNTGQNFNLTTTYHLYSVALHEIGHVLGLGHSYNLSAVMYTYYGGTKFDLHTDDRDGIRAIYGAGAARTDDAYDLGALDNGTFAAATSLTDLFANLTLLQTNLDLTTATDKDFFTFTTPAGSASTMTVKVQSQGLSLLSPKVTVYAANQSTVLGSATGYGDYDGSTLTVTVNGVTPLTQYYVKVEGAETLTNPISWQAFNTGAYALTVNVGTGDNPIVPLPNTQTVNGNPIQGGGGIPTSSSYETLVNTTTSNVQQTHSESREAVAMDELGNYVVVWSSQGQDGDGWGVYGQRFNAAGDKLGNEFRVNTTTAGNQFYPAVAMNGVGTFVVTWVSDGQDGSGQGVYGQRYAPGGTPLGGEFRVNSTTTNNQSLPNVTVDSTGGFVAVWVSDLQDGSGSGIYGQRYKPTGAKNGGEFRINTATAGDQQRPSVATRDIDGDFIVTWSSYGQDGSGWGVYAKKYDEKGVADGGEFRVNTTTGNDQDYSSVAAGPQGDFVITWSGNSQDGSGWGIYAQRYNSSSVAQGGEFRVNTTTAADQLYSSVAMDNFNNFLIAWSSDGQDGNGLAVYARPFSASGVAQADEFQVNTSWVGDQTAASVAISTSGDAVVVWSGKQADDQDGVALQRYRVNGANGLHNLGAGEPHGYGEEGSDADHRRHDHAGDATEAAFPSGPRMGVAPTLAAQTGRRTERVTSDAPEEKDRTVRTAFDPSAVPGAFRSGSSRQVAPPAGNAKKVTPAGNALAVKWGGIAQETPGWATWAGLFAAEENTEDRRQVGEMCFADLNWLGAAWVSAELFAVSGN